MSKSQQVALGQTLAGTNQYKVLAAILSNFQTAIDATNASMNSAGATTEQNNKYLEGFQAKLNELKQVWQSMINGKGGFANFGKVLLDIAKGILNLINRLGGLKTIVAILATTLLPKLLTAIVKFFYQLQIGDGLFKRFATSITTAKTAIIGFKKGTEGLSTVMASVGVAVTNVISVVGTLVTVGMTLYSLFSSFKKAPRTVKDISEEFDKLDEDLEVESNKLSEIKTKLDSINTKIENLKKLEITDDDQITKLEQERDLLQTQLKIQEKLNLTKLEESTKEKISKSQEQVKVGTEFVQESSTIYGLYVPVDIYRSPAEQLKYQTEQIIDFEKQYSEAISQMNEARTDEDKEYWSKQAEFFENSKTKIIEDSEQYYDIINDTYNSIVNVREKYKELYGEESSEYKNKKKETSDYYDFYEGLIEDYGQVVTITTEKVKENQGDIDENLEEIVTDLERFTKKIDEISKKVSNLKSIDLNGIEEAFSKARKSIDEYNNSGEMTVATFESLIGLDANYLQILLDEEGQLDATTDAEMRLYYAKIDQLAVDKAIALIKQATDLKDEGLEYSEYAKKVDLATNSLWGLVCAELASVEANNSLSKESLSLLKGQISTLEMWAEQTKESIRVSGSYSRATSNTTSEIDKNTEALKANADALKAQKDALTDEVNNYKKVISYIDNKISDIIDKTKKLKDKEVDAIKEQIDALKEEKDISKDFWNEKIQALEDANSELETQIEYEQLLKDLEEAKSKKVKVYKEGQGFVYTSDVTAISSAQNKLNEYNRKKKYQDEKKALEKSRDDQEKIYEEQIKNLENYQKSVEEKYDSIIQKYTDYKDKFKESVNSYETEQNRLLALQLTGIDFEKDGWETRLSNLDSFVSRYSSKLASLQSITEAYDKAQQAYEESKAKYEESKVENNVTDYDSKKSNYKNDWWTYEPRGTYNTQGEATYNINNLNGDDYIKVGSQYKVVKWGKGYSSEQLAKKYANKGELVYKRYATGVSNVNSDQIALIGDNPNAELVIGSKLNGNFTSISKGSGVVNATSTKTLAGIINQLGNYAQSGFGSGNGILTSSTNNDIISINNVVIEGSNITDINSFKNALFNLKSEAIQRAYKR